MLGEFGVFLLEDRVYSLEGHKGLCWIAFIPGLLVLDNEREDKLEDQKVVVLDALDKREDHLRQMLNIISIKHRTPLAYCT